MLNHACQHQLSSLSASKREQPPWVQPSDHTDPHTTPENLKESTPRPGHNHAKDSSRAETMNLQSQEHLLAPFDSLVWMYPESSLVKVLANVTDSTRFTTVFVDLYLPFFFLFSQQLII